MTQPDRAYDTLAGVYEWLVPDAMLTPEGAAGTFAAAVEGIPAGGRVLDCATGTGQLAVGLALQGFEVVASDASPAMVERTRELAAEYGASLSALACRWDQLGPEAVGGGLFDAVFCVGNSLPHAGAAEARRGALKNMASVLGDGGLLVIATRNWELMWRRAPGLEIGGELVERRGRKGLVVYNWALSDVCDRPQFFDVAVALIEEGGKVATRAERLTFWPFTRDELDEDLRHAGLTPECSTYADEVERYLVTARR